MRQEDYQKLTAQARCGDTAAMERLLNACRQRLKEMVTDVLPQKLNGDWDPSDAVQESLLDAYRGLPAFRGQQPEALWAWLRTILEHNIADRLKYQQRLKRNGGPHCSLSQAERKGKLLIADQSSVSSRVIRQERLQRLNRLIRRLPEPQALVFRLRHLHGLPLEEIAKQTGRTYPSIAGLLIRATRRMNQLLQKEDSF